MAAGIYEIVHDGSGRRYVGSSKNIESRLKQHAAMLDKGCHHSLPMQRSWLKYGRAAFSLRALAILEPCELLSTEQRLLDQVFAEGGNFNVARFAHAAMRARKHSPETRAKMSAARTGLVATPETRQKLRLSKLGITLPQAHRESIRLGKQNVSQETREKMRAARLGVVPWNKGVVVMAVCKRGHEQTSVNRYHDKKRNKFSCRPCRAIHSAAQVKQAGEIS